MATDRIGAAFIGGAWQEISGSSVLPLIDPATEDQAGLLVSADSTTIDAAVAAARVGFAQWRTAGREARLAALDALIAGIEARREDFAQTISQEIGAPIDFARRAQVAAGLDHLRATRVALASDTDDIQLAGPAHRVRYEPVGVAALITPWNWPLNQVVLKVGAALATGCAMILKPSEYATRSAMLFAEIMAELELPPGVFNLICGDRETGAALVAHAGVDIISFTGSTKAGASIAATAARRFARTTLELGGKSPNLLFEDCDLEVAIRQGLAHCFRNSGQSCNAASRMLVARPIYDEAVRLAGEIADATPLGPPQEPGPHLGPLVNRAQFDRVQDFIAAGVRSGARLMSGGTGRAEGFNHGFYVRPTVFADVDRSNALFQGEIFGPVLTMTPFESDDEGVALANDTNYGLAAYVQTQDVARADRVSRALNAGMIQVNGTSRAQGAPFGGIKASGWGREAGIWGMRSFQNVKSISGAASAAD